MANDRAIMNEASNANPSSTETLKNKAQETAVEFRERADETRDQVREHTEALISHQGLPEAQGNRQDTESNGHTTGARGEKNGAEA